MPKGGALKPVYIVTDDQLEINGGDFVLQQGPALKVRGFSLDNYAGRKIQGGAAQPIYVVPEASAPALHGGHWRVIAGQPIKVLSVTNAERNIIQGPAVPVYPVDDDGNYDSSFAGGFSPTDIAGLIIWLDAGVGTFQDNLYTVPAVNNADPIGGWQDQSGNARHVTQAVAGNKPTLRTVVLNGHSVVRFDGNDYLTNLAMPDITGSCTVFVVVKYGAPAAWQTVYDYTSAVANKGHFIYHDFAVSKWNCVDGGGVKFVSSAANYRDNVFRIHTGRADDPSNQIEYLVNDASKGFAIWTDFNNVLDRVWIGATLGGGNGLVGDIAEYLVYDSLLSAGDEDLVYGYLSAKYAL